MLQISSEFVSVAYFWPHFIAQLKQKKKSGGGKNVRTTFDAQHRRRRHVYW